MTPFDRPHINVILGSIVTIALSCTVSDIFGFEKYYDLEIRVRGHSRSLKLVPFDSLTMVSYERPIVA